MEFSPDWSNDGERIAYNGKKGTNYKIFIYSFITSLSEKLNIDFTGSDDWDALSPVWSPDDNKIAFIIATDYSQPTEIYLVSSNGGVPSKLTDEKKRIENLTWSPDGSKLCFTARQNLFTDDTDLFMIDTTGGEAVCLYDCQSWLMNPCWSPEGYEIAFSMVDSGSTNIFKLNAKSEKLTQITFDGECYDPAWSPDMKWIAYNKGADISTNKVDIFVIPADGGDALKLTNSSQGKGVYHIYDEAAWAPDGTQLALTSSKDGGYRIWIMSNLPTAIDAQETSNSFSDNFQLIQNYPNPFNPNTKIKYSIPKQSNVTLKVFNVLGSEVETLVQKIQPQGNYEVEFDGAELTSGIYFYRLQAGAFTEARKMMLIK